MAKIRVNTYREVENPDGKIKLPQEVVINLPAEKLSKNDREWTDVSNGVKASNRAIERGVPILYMYFGHPCWDDPIASGMMPVTRLTKLVENGDTSVDFYGQMEYGTDLLPNKTALFLGGAIAAGCEIDCSIRAAADYKWDWEDNATLSIPDGDYPLLIDWLPPDQQPGIPGTKLTQVLKWESAGKKIKESFKESKLFKELIDEVINFVKSEINDQKAGANATGRKEKSMPVAQTEMSADVLKQIEELPDKESIVIFIKGMLAAMGVKDDSAVADMDKMDSEPAESDYPKDDTGKESFARAQRIWKAKVEHIIPAVKAAVEKHAAAIKQGKESTALVPTPKAAIVKAEGKADMTDDEKEIQEMLQERRYKRESAKRLITITETKQKAIDGKAKFYGHEIWDQRRYPQVLVDKALQDCADWCGTEREMERFFSERLKTIAAEAQIEAMKQGAQQLPGKQYLEGVHLETVEGWVGEVDPWIKIAEERVAKPILSYIEHNSPADWERYQTNMANPAYRKRVQEKARQWARLYREDFIANGLDQNGNYPALMIGNFGMVNDWIDSPVMQLAQSGPQLGMNLLRSTAGQGGMPLGQFIEITSMSSSPEKDYDLAQRQLASDALPQHELFSQPYQYFAQWREEEIVTNKDALYWLSQDPYKRDLDAEANFWLLKNMKRGSELRVTAENIRSSCAYGATALTNETLNLAQANHYVVFGSDPKVVEGLTVENGVGYMILRRGQASGTVTLEKGPIVPPGISPFLERSTESLLNMHPVTVAAINGKTQVRGKYDRRLQRGVKINESDPDPTYFVLPHVGIIVFLAGSNFDGVNATVVSQYTPVSNYTRFDCALSGSETHQIKGNQLVELIIRMIADLRVKRQVTVEEIDYLIGSALILEGQMALASHFQGQNALEFTKLGPGIQANAQYLQILRRLLVWGTTDPFYDDNRLLTLGSSRNLVYKQYMPPLMGDKLTCGKIDADGKLRRTHQQATSIVFRELIATIPTRDPETDEPRNFANANIYIVNPPADTGLPA